METETIPFIIIGIICAIVLIIAVVLGLILVARSIDSGGGERSEKPKKQEKPKKPREKEKSGFWEWIFTPEYKREGIRGEIAASKIIQSVLKDGDRLFTNVNIEYDGKPAELDDVVVNKYGVFIIEVKNYTGYIVGGAEDYEWKKYKTTDGGNTYEKTVKNPIKQVKRQVHILARYLEYYGVKVWVRGYAILLHGNSPVKSEYILTGVDEISRAIHTVDRRMLNNNTVEEISKLIS